MQYIDSRYAAFVWDAVDELKPNQEVRCSLPERPNERWSIRYIGIGRGFIVELNNFDEEDQTCACFRFLLESRRHALLLSLRASKSDQDEMCHKELVTLSGSGLPSILDLDQHHAWTQLVNVIFGSAKWLGV
jgi:hypothetical protein